MKNNTNIKSASLFRGATYLAVGTFLAKLIGAIYRIPLTNMLGGVGLGLYQMVFPVYCVLLDFAGAGIPNAIARIIGAYKGEDFERNASGVLKTSIKLLSVLGVICTLIMLIFSRLLSTLQGNSNATLGYIFLAPAVFAVSLISCFRGYFQGKMNMFPTAISQVVEQVVKAVVGLIAVYLLLPNIPLAVGGATLAVSISEFVALLGLLVSYKKDKKMVERFTYDKNLFKPLSKTIIKNVFPITLVGIAIPLSQVIDSFIIINILSRYRSDATSLFGLMSGTAMTIINLPVAICYAFATVAVPAISGAKNKSEISKNSTLTLLITFVVALPCALICFFFAQPITNLLFRGLPIVEKTITIKLIKMLSPIVLLLSLMQTENAILIGKGKLYLPLISMGAGILVKTILSVILLPMPNLNIYGGAISLIACYFVSVLVNLFIIYQTGNSNAKKVKNRGLCSQ